RRRPCRQRHHPGHRPPAGSAGPAAGHHVPDRRPGRGDVLHQPRPRLLLHRLGGGGSRRLSSMFLAEPGLLDLSLSFLAEVIAFLAMVVILGIWVYPRIIAAAEGRQRQIAEQLEAAEKARKEAEQRLEE